MAFPDYIFAFSIHLDDVFLTENLKILLKIYLKQAVGVGGALYNIREKGNL